MTREIMELVGLDSRRLGLEWVSSAEGARFAQIVTSFTGTIKELGKSSLGVAA